MEGSRRDGILSFATALRGGYHAQDERLEIDKSTAREQELIDRLVECLIHLTIKCPTKPTYVHVGRY